MVPWPEYCHLHQLPCAELLCLPAKPCWRLLKSSCQKHSQVPHVPPGFVPWRRWPAALPGSSSYWLLV